MMPTFEGNSQVESVLILHFIDEHSMPIPLPIMLRHIGPKTNLDLLNVLKWRAIRYHESRCFPPYHKFSQVQGKGHYTHIELLRLRLWIVLAIAKSLLGATIY